MPAVEALFCYLDPGGAGYLPFDSDEAMIVIRPCPGDDAEGNVVGCMWCGPADLAVGLTPYVLRDMGYWTPPAVIDYFPWRLRRIGSDGYRDLVYYMREAFYPIL